MSRILIVTGGSRGIGAAAARAAARDGWHVVLTYRSGKAEAQVVVDEIVRLGGTAEARYTDVAKEGDVAALFDHVTEQYGRLDGLVNNAGILPPVSCFEEIDLARWTRTFSINATGPFLCCRAAVGLMAKRHGGEGGSIVNVSSMAASLGAPNEFIDYAASKGAIETLTVGLSKEFGVDGIRVNAVRPGLIATEIHASAGDAARVERLASGVPLGRPGSAEETAEAIIWLLSDASSYVTGCLMPVSGGR
ncbi:short chain dehydrogenase [Octadecabacter arcticus 238]|jgi:NAD(P)-dependent dehydrogenase (short-subunit alcohol dehydrogenase family)|uniref:Short chain dehydrogenase n=1 Tax=Octadecabacter arcticus 238 TaxID=391616 RepID=M9RK02_9RHOB|nr:SDR family oxidoreductase [Octadecabacter arcticus]AGI72487.1 short chain dehydrogenase [Octadecabacter arcticus 238]